MKKLAILLALLCTVAFAQQKGTFTDSRDGKKYKTVKIGTQTWMAENLNFEAPGSLCPENKPANCQKYGRLYDWITAMGIDKQYASKKWKRASYYEEKIVGITTETELIGSDIKHQGICPSGWHLPNSAEWKILRDFAGDDSEKKLKTTNGWDIYKWEEWTGKYFFDERDGVSKKKMEKKSRSGNGTDAFGFSALPGGGCTDDNYCESIGDAGIWWSATEPDHHKLANTWVMTNQNGYFTGDVSRHRKGIKHSIRCVMD